ncbi:hypothetical protein GCM10023187_09890 [Nibrella viscosa]|uniref:RNA polymerase sigma-70 factor, ECF subfamily n=2 Tax=Nibrella viscosa TaxID=1084524 RepID=A0ABP8K0C4_9BACT
MDFLDGNEAAFGQLYQRYYKDLYRYGKTLEADEELIKDAIQDLFINLHQYRSGLKPVTSVKFYLMGSLRHKLQGYFRQAKRNEETCQGLLHLDAPVDVSAEDRLIDAERCGALHHKLAEAVNNLPSRQREVIRMKFYEEQPLPFIEQTMNIRYQTVANLSSRALKRLNTELSSYL